MHLMCIRSNVIFFCEETNMRGKFIVAISVLVAGVSAATAGTVSFYTDRDAWNQAATESVRYLDYSVLETFDDGVVDGVVREFPDGLVVNYLDPFFSVDSVNGSLGLDSWHGYLGAGLSPTQWSFNAPVIAWGGIFSDVWSDRESIGAVVMPAFGGEAWLDSTSLIPLGYDGFFGIVSDTKFDSVVLSTPNLEPGPPNPNWSRTFYNLDDMEAVVPNIPVPSSLLLLSVGLAGFGFMSRIRARQS